MTLTCWFCMKPAQTIGWGFAVCRDGRCAEQARGSTSSLCTTGVAIEICRIPRSPIAEITDDEFLDNS